MRAWWLLVIAAQAAADPAKLALPVAAGSQARPAPIIVVASGGSFAIAKTTAALDGDKLAMPKTTPTTPLDVARLAGPAGVLVLADAGSTAAALEPLAVALDNECWALPATADGKLTGLWPQPCPTSRPPKSGLPELALYIEPDKIAIGKSVAGEFATVTRAELLAKLETYKAHADFAKRTDLSYAVSAELTIGELVGIVAIARDAGFTSARYVPQVWLPLQFPNGIGPAAAPVWNGGGGFQKSVRSMVGPASGQLGPRTQDEIDRVVKSRTGLWRACYQRELNRVPGLGGKLVATFTIAADGLVTDAKVKFQNESVSSCVRGNFMRLRFPAKPGQSKASITITYASP